MKGFGTLKSYIYIDLMISDFLDTMISLHRYCSHTLLEQEIILFNWYL